MPMIPSLEPAPKPTAIPITRPAAGARRLPKHRCPLGAGQDERIINRWRCIETGSEECGMTYHEILRVYEPDKATYSLLIMINMLFLETAGIV